VSFEKCKCCQKPKCAACCAARFHKDLTKPATYPTTLNLEWVNSGFPVITLERLFSPVAEDPEDPFDDYFPCAAGWFGGASSVNDCTGPIEIITQNNEHFCLGFVVSCNHCIDPNHFPKPCDPFTPVWDIIIGFFFCGNCNISLSACAHNVSIEKCGKDTPLHLTYNTCIGEVIVYE
jgi:hypothetical protein